MSIPGLAFRYQVTRDIGENLQFDMGQLGPHADIAQCMISLQLVRSGLSPNPYEGSTKRQTIYENLRVNTGKHAVTYIRLISNDRSNICDANERIRYISSRFLDLKRQTQSSRVGTAYGYVAVQEDSGTWHLFSINWELLREVRHEQDLVDITFAHVNATTPNKLVTTVTVWLHITRQDCKHVKMSWFTT